MIAVILTDWLGYELTREKQLGRSGIRITVGAGPLLANMARFSAGVPFVVILALNDLDASSSSYSMVEDRAASARQRWLRFAQQFPFVTRVQFRPNVDLDIGAYDHGLQLLRREKFEGDVLFMNSSLRGPSAHDWLARYHALFHERADIGLCGLTLSAVRVIDGFPKRPHLQSTFLYTNMGVLQEVFPKGLYEGSLSSKQEAISHGEIAISQAVLRHGYALRCAAFPDFIYKLGDPWQIPLVYGWRAHLPELAEKYANAIL
ncbi:MAG TPA: hypothetical protein VLQ46_03660 [Casimicrobiaceae bacterium]|nr:hypothetical protein [Casimicrobiaceae bacterium]